MLFVGETSAEKSAPATPGPRLGGLILRGRHDGGPEGVERRGVQLLSVAPQRRRRGADVPGLGSAEEGAYVERAAAPSFSHEVARMP